jgi:hypothetical protein
VYVVAPNRSVSTRVHRTCAPSAVMPDTPMATYTGQRLRASAGTGPPSVVAGSG